MTKNQKKHLTLENREVIEAGLLQESPCASDIARKLGVSTSTVTREVYANRTVCERKLPKGAKASTRCVHYATCQASGSACGGCQTKFTTCKQCRTRRCIDTCKSYKRTMCPKTQSWPFICPKDCSKRAWCKFPLTSYTAQAAHDIYQSRLVSSRQGSDISQEQLEAINSLVVPLLKQGQSFEAIWATHKEELGISIRTAYTYQEKGLINCAALELPRKVRMKPRKKKQVSVSSKQRVDRTGRLFEDFCMLPLTDVARVVQGDSVEGFEHNEHDILSLHVAFAKFQFYLYKKHGSSKAVVTWLDVIEQALGSPEAFEKIFGILLVDRGGEFDDWAGMERSCIQPDKRRCRVFYCNPMSSNQKSEAERNHEQLRRILPKNRSNFDALNAWDVAICASHVNSYPTGGKDGVCAFERLGALVPQNLFDELGYERMDPDDVVLKPWLMAHAVEQ